MNLIRKVVGALGLISALVSLSHAAPLVSESPIRATGTGTTVTVSSSAWTLIPTASSLDGRTGMIVSYNLERTSSTLAGNIGACTGFAEATTVRPMHFLAGSFVLVPLPNTQCLYLLSLETNTTVSAHVKEVKQ